MDGFGQPPRDLGFADAVGGRPDDDADAPAAGRGEILEIEDVTFEFGIDRARPGASGASGRRFDGLYTGYFRRVCDGQSLRHCGVQFRLRYSINRFEKWRQIALAEYLEYVADPA